MAVTLADIARRANVAPATVSRILSRSPHFSVSDAKRQEVLSIARDLDYRPKRAARALVSGKTQTVAVVLGAMSRDFSSPAFSVALTELIRTLWSQGFATSLLPVDDTPEAVDESVIQTLQESHADGYFVPNAYLKPRTLKLLERNGTPVVSLAQPGRKKCDSYVSYVELDELTVYREVIRELTELGHERVACFGFASVMKSRYPVWQRAIACERPPFFLKKVSYDVDAKGPLHDRKQAELAAQQRWNELKEATAIICTSDLVAMGLLDVLQQREVVAGSDVTVIGEDNIEDNPVYKYSGHLPQITTIDRLSVQRGRVMAELLLERMHKQGSKAVTRRLPLQFIRRSTHGPAPRPV